MRKIINKYQFGDMSVLYFMDDQQRVELVLCPFSKEKDICIEKKGMSDSLIQFMVEGDGGPHGFAAGHTQRNSQSIEKLVFIEQRYVKQNSISIVETEFLYDNCLKLIHTLTHRDGDRALKVQTEAINNGNKELTLTSLSSFSLGMLTPFAIDETYNRLDYYRIRSRWSAEGRVERGAVEELQLEPSWARHGISVERYGQVGSMPVRKFFPFGAIEDKEEGVIWAAQLAVGSSWQMEFYRKDESLCLSGGISDYEFGHFKKTLRAGDNFITPSAFLTVCEGEFDEVSQRLLDLHEESVLFDGTKKGGLYDKLPSVFNEYCTTWGNPSHKNICSIIDKIKDKDFDYFVIDAGWYADREIDWQHNMGDWEVSKELFPDGLQKTVDCIKNAGFRPGIWFELETVGKLANALSQTDHLLKRDGKVIRSGDRFFWDMRDPWTREYLKSRVIDFLNQYGFEYIKIDYNDTIGIGCDGAESLGAGLYENIAATREFFKEIHKCVPSICIELCSSGGHRLEPSFLNITDMASFSDAHEEPEIPVIAANVHRTMLPEKSQIWCVIRETDSSKRICYSLCATFLGVLCISGDVLNLPDEQWKLIDGAIAFYRRIDNITKHGTSYFFGKPQSCYRKLENWQGVLRKAGDEAYLVVHSFGTKNQHISIDLSGEYEIIDKFEEREHAITQTNGVIEFDLAEEFEALALYLRRK